jgi:hypothetical protein
MPFPVSRDDLEREIRSQYHYEPDRARAIVGTLEGSGAVQFHGPELSILNPTTQEAHLIAGLVHGVLGRSLGSAGQYKLREFVEELNRQAAKKGTQII